MPIYEFWCKKLKMFFFGVVASLKFFCVLPFYYTELKMPVSDLDIANWYQFQGHHQETFQSAHDLQQNLKLKFSKQKQTQLCEISSKS